MIGNAQANAAIICAIIGGIVTLLSVWFTHYLALKRESRRLALPDQQARGRSRESFDSPCSASRESSGSKAGRRIKRLILLAAAAALIVWGGAAGLYHSWGGSELDAAFGILCGLCALGAVYQLVRLVLSLLWWILFK